MTKVDGRVLIPVAASSHIEALGYDPQSGKAFVEFKPGQAVWEYWPVKRNEWAMIAMSPSKGTALHAIKRKKNIMAAKVAAERIER